MIIFILFLLFTSDTCSRTKIRSPKKPEPAIIPNNPVEEENDPEEKYDIKEEENAPEQVDDPKKEEENAPEQVDDTDTEPEIKIPPIKKVEEKKNVSPTKIEEKEEGKENTEFKLKENELFAQTNSDIIKVKQSYNKFDIKEKKKFLTMFYPMELDNFFGNNKVFRQLSKNKIEYYIDNYSDIFKKVKKFNEGEKLLKNLKNSQKYQITAIAKLNLIKKLFSKLEMGSQNQNKNIVKYLSQNQDAVIYINELLGVNKKTNSENLSIFIEKVDPDFITWKRIIKITKDKENKIDILKIFAELKHDNINNDKVKEFIRQLSIYKTQMNIYKRKNLLHYNNLDKIKSEINNPKRLEALGNNPKLIDIIAKKNNQEITDSDFKIKN